MKWFFQSLLNSRTIIISILTILVLIIYLVWYSSSIENPKYEFLLNFFPEFIGMAITIILIDSFFRMSQFKSDLKSLAWDILHDADYIVWAWQGGARIYDYEELIYLVKNIDERDLLSPEAQNIILEFGNKAANRLNTDRKLIGTNRKCKEALKEFSKLSQIRDNGKLKPVSEIAEALKTGIEKIAIVLKIQYSPDKDFGHLEKDCAQLSQIWRITGISKELLKTKAKNEGLI